MHTGVSSSWVVWHVFFERYTRVLMEASSDFPIHFLKIYSWTIQTDVSRVSAGAFCALFALYTLHRADAATAGSAQAPYLGHDARVDVRWRWCAGPCRPRAGHARGPRGTLACRLSPTS